VVNHIKNYFDENRLFYAAALTLFIANVIILFTAIHPGRRKVEDLNREYFVLRKEKTKINEDLKRKEAYSSKIAVLRKDMESFISELPHQKEMTSIIKKIHSLAGKEGLKIRTVKYSRIGIKDEKISASLISFPLTGRYRQVRKLIYNLEKMPYLMSIDGLDITSKKLKTVSLSLRVSIYFKKG